MTIALQVLPAGSDILQHIHHKKPSTNKHDDIPPFLRRFITLLTCGDESDKEAKRIVAVTGTFKNGNMGLGVKALIVTQNPKPSSDVVGIKKVMIGLISFDDVVKRYDNISELQEILEVWHSSFFAACNISRTNETSTAKYSPSTIAALMLPKPAPTHPSQA